VLDLTHYALLTTAVATALFHTLIPDHWLPFVLVGRAQSWTVGKTVAVAGASATVHAAFSIVLGLAMVAFGQVAAHAFGETLADVSHVLLIVFGLVYAVWAWRKGGHFHPGGNRLHAGMHGAGCSGDEGPEHPEHLHYHADMPLIEDRAHSHPWWLAFIVGANPCLLLFPLLVETADAGAAKVTAVVLAYTVPTIVLMVGLSALGVATSRRIPLPWAARQMEAASGLLIALLGVVLWVAGH
jgi:hypothetical protein